MAAAAPATNNNNANPTRWGVAGVGKDASDFVSAVSTLNGAYHQVAAVAAAAKPAVAEKFARDHGLVGEDGKVSCNVHGNFRDLANDPSVQVVFVAAANPAHARITKLMLNHGKHVLCESPLAVNPAQTKGVVKVAISKKLFLMEAVATKFLAAHEKANRMIKNGKIGEPMHFSVTLGSRGKPGKGKNMRQRKNGGGTVLEYGHACVHLALALFGGEKPEKIVASGIGMSEDGADLGVVVVLNFSGGRVATFVTDLRVDLPNSAYIAGTEGTLQLGPNIFDATEVTFTKGGKQVKKHSFLPQSDEEDKKEAVGGKGEKGKAKKDDKAKKDEQLKEEDEDEEASVPKKAASRGLTGFAKQAEEVRRCLKKKSTESSELPVERSLLAAEIVGEITRLVGVSFDDVAKKEEEKEVKEEEEQKQRREERLKKQKEQKAAAVAAPAAAPAAAPSAAKKEEAKKEEAKKEEPKKEAAKKDEPKKEEAKKELPKKEEAKKK